MLDHWLQPFQLEIPEDQFRRFVAHPAFRSEYQAGRLTVWPRPKNFHCLLPIRETVSRQQLAVRGGSLVRIAQLSPIDEPALVELFVSAFSRTVPLCQLRADVRRQCAAECLTRTFEGRDGPLVRDACFVARDESERLCGAILITLLQRGDLDRFDDPRWMERPPDDAVEGNWGRPHLTWVFVRPEMARWGIGAELLCCSLAALYGRGYEELASTILLGNQASMLWHWKMGFQLLSHPGSARKMFED